MFRLPSEWITQVPYSVHTWMDSVSVNYSLLPWPWLYLPFVAFLIASILGKSTRAIIIFTLLLGVERIFGVTIAGFLLIGAGTAWTVKLFRRAQTEPIASAVKLSTGVALTVLVGAILFGFPRVVNLSPVTCNANFRGVGTAIEMYQTDWGAPPSSLTHLTPNYLKTIPSCPADFGKQQSLTFSMEPGRYVISCKNAFHNSPRGRIEPLVTPLSAP